MNFDAFALCNVVDRVPCLDELLTAKIRLERLPDKPRAKAGRDMVFLEKEQVDVALSNTHDELLFLVRESSVAELVLLTLHEDRQADSDNIA